MNEFDPRTCLLLSTLLAIMISCNNQKYFDSVDTINTIEKNNQNKQIQYKELPPPPPKKPQFIKDFESEQDSLRKNRESKVRKLMKQVGEDCLLSDKESFVLHFVLSVEGFITKPKIFKEKLEYSNTVEMIYNCLQTKIGIEELNLGEIKASRTARNNKAFPQPYTIPITKKISLTKIK